MSVYTISQVKQQFSILLKKALSEGQIKFKTDDGQVFVIRPEITAKNLRLRFAVLSCQLPRQIYWMQFAKVGQDIYNLKRFMQAMEDKNIRATQWVALI